MSRVAVVTGGGSGVGLGVCRHLAEAGHRLAVVDLDSALAASAADQLRAAGAEAFAATVDVADRAAVEAALNDVRRHLGPVEILVTSAAVSGFVALEELSADLWDRTLAVNLTGTFNCVQAVIGDMVARAWGRIVTVSSAAGQTGSLRQAHYSASKAGVIGFTKAIALEYAGRGITANSVPPFVVDTPMLRAAQEAQLLPKSETLAKMIPANRLGTPDDVGAVCAFLCSEGAGYVTGQVVAVNGGAVT